MVVVACLKPFNFSDIFNTLKNKPILYCDNTYQEIQKNIGCSGEEYEILFTFDPKHRNKIQKIAYEYGVVLNIFAKATDGIFECDCKDHHF